MKKIYTAILAVITAAALAGCGENSETPAASGSDSTPIQGIISSSHKSEESGGGSAISYDDTESSSGITLESSEAFITVPEETADYDEEEIDFEAEYQPVEADFVPGYSVEIPTGTSSYDPQKALDFARKNWDSDKGLCAEFGSDCIKAGGVTDCWSTSSTQLYNSLIKSGLGYAVKIKVNDNGTINLPESAFPGDLVFFYCEKENCMVHTTIYCGDSKNGTMKALAHNPASSGVKQFRYRPTCTDECRGELKDVVLFTFFRNPDIMKAPQSVPSVSMDLEDDFCSLSWSPDFVYKSSTLVVNDKNGKEIYRREMGTDTGYRLIIKNTSSISAYVEFTICDGVTISGNPVKFTLGSENERSEDSEIISELPPKKPDKPDGDLPADNSGSTDLSDSGGNTGTSQTPTSRPAGSDSAGSTSGDDSKTE